MLNHRQLEALNILRTGKNVFLTGKAGTGKSFVLDYFLSEMEDRNIIVCVPTGIAALNIHGATLHRTFNVPIEPIFPQKEPLRINKAIREADIIVIDEIFMCRFDYFEYVAKCIRLAEKEAQNKENVMARKERREPIAFQPKQVIVVGDFFQLPPVITEKDRSVLERYWGDQMSVGDGFAFQAPMWKEFQFFTVILEEPIRQREDVLFVKHLNKIRGGESNALSCLEKNAAQEKQTGKKTKKVYLTSPLQSRYLICSEAVLNFYNHGIRVYDPITKGDEETEDIVAPSIKTIECVIDNIEMFQFIRDFVKKEDDGLYYCDGQCVKRKKEETLSVNFRTSNSYEVFSMFGSLWGGWNDCPDWRTMERKSKEWYEKYGAEIIKISHDSLEFRCKRKLSTKDAEQLMLEIAGFAPNSMDLADYETIRDKLIREGRFVLWWD